MTIQVVCRCGSKLGAQPHLAGKTVSCPACGSPVTIPVVQSNPFAEVAVEVVDTQGSRLGTAPLAAPLVQPAHEPAPFQAPPSSSNKGLTIALVVGGVAFAGILAVGVLLALLLPAVQAARKAAIRAAAPRQWITYSSPSEGYTVSLPVQPVRSSETQLGITMQIATADIGMEGHFEVGSYDVPFANWSWIFDKDAALDGAVKGIVDRVEAQLISQRKIQHNGYPGREYVCTIRQNGNTFAGIGRVYFVNTTMYLLFWAGPTGAGSSDAQRFFGSFQGTGRPKGKANPAGGE